MSNPLLSLLDIDYPLIQAPMAGVSTPALAAAVSNAGALGSLGLGASTVAQAEAVIVATRQLTDRPFNVNLFCHAPPRRDARREADWATTLRPHFARYGSTPPDSLSEIYQTFIGHAPMLELLLDLSPAVVSFHFGLPEGETIQRLRRQGIVTLATATSLQEALLIEQQGIDVVVAQGYEAGGHRGIFAPQAPDAQLSTFTLVQLLRRRLTIPGGGRRGHHGRSGDRQRDAVGGAGRTARYGVFTVSGIGRRRGYRAAIHNSLDGAYGADLRDIRASGTLSGECLLCAGGRLSGERRTGLSAGV